MRCIVPNCGNDSNVSSETITYHKFPSHDPMRAAWVAALRAGGWSGARGAVCSRHFPRAALATSVGGRRRLRADAVPLLQTPGKQKKHCSVEETDADQCDVKACRMCFASACQLYLMREYRKLYVAYEILAGLSLEREARLPPYLCGECARRVLRCERVRGAALRAHRALLGLVRSHRRITLELLKSVRDEQSLSKIDDIDMDFDTELAEDDIVDEKPPVNINHVDVDSIKTEASNIVAVEFVGAGDPIADGPTPVLGSPETVLEDEVEVKREFTKSEIKQESDNEELTNADTDPEDVVDEDTSPDEKSPQIKKESKPSRGRKVTPRRERDEAKAVILRGPKIAKGLLRDNKYCCDSCPYNTQCESVLTKHLKAHAAPVAYSCNTCRFITVSRRNIRYHIKGHNDDVKRFLCDVCPKKFRKSHALKVHLRVHTGEKPFACDICTTGFSQKDALKVHLRTHTGERPHRCTVCDRTFDTKGHLTTHFRIHSGQKPYTCRICDKLFAFKTSLNNHMRTHLGVIGNGSTSESDKPYACQVCNKRFFYPNSLSTHSRVHSDEKPYSCKTCDEAFTQWTALRNHLKTHSGEAPYTCEFCNSQFMYRSLLKIHLMKHTGEKPFVCEICNKSFAQKVSLKTHVLKHTGEKPFSCEVCSKAFSNQSNLRRHSQIHSPETYSCDVCSKTFNTKQNLTHHAWTHSTQKRYSCDVCSKAFKQKRTYIIHSKTHSGEQ